MRYLGIDYGAQRIGIALSDEAGTIAFPEKTIQNDRDVFTNISDLVREKKVEAIVMGDTRTAGGAENPITKDSDAFAEALKKRVGIPLHSVFEAWSSIEASRFTNKPHDDASAAAIILQRFLDMRGGVQSNNDR